MPEQEQSSVMLKTMLISWRKSIAICVALILIMFVWRNYTTWIDYFHSPTAESVTSRVTAGRSVMTSRVTTQKITARPDKWSDFIRIPPSHIFRWHTENPKDCVMVKDGRDQIRQVCADHVYLGKLPSLLDGMMAFKSIEEKEVEVIVEWEPK
jgi:hypothetical protein